MFVSPQTLRDYCLDFLRQRIDASVTCEGLNGALAEELLRSLSLHSQLSDDVLLKPLFDARNTRLHAVHFDDASQLTTRGLRALRAHRLRGLTVRGLSRATINELIGCLGDQSLHDLRALDVSRSAFTNHNKFCVVIGLAKLRSLRALDVSHTDFNGHGLEIVVDDLPLLRALNISATRVRDISALRKCANRLTSLSVYNLSFGETSLSVVQQLPLLEALDVSDDSDNPLDALATRDRHHVRQLLQSGHLFARLQELDISGRDGVDCALVTRFLAAKHAAAADALPLRFLGLLQTSVASDDLAFGDADLVVSGNASEKQILEALRRYGLRANFVQKSLFHLYAFTQTLADARADLIEAVVAPMAVHSRAIAVQMAATACLYNLSKNQFGDRLHPSTLRAVVERTLAAMQNFPNHQQLQKNSLLTICSDRVLQDVSFDRFLCTQLVLDSLVQFKDTAMNRMAVAIVSILAAKISTAETSVLGAKAVYMEALLAIVRARLADALHNDIMLKFTLSALWNLTDESPKTCQMFLQKGGLDLYLQVLQRFEGECAVETKVLGLVNNIAEVEELRHNLLDLHFLRVLRLLMRSPKIDVSYFAAGIFAHLCADQSATSSALHDLHALLRQLKEVVLSWATPDIEMVAYRSFVPFLPLLNCFQWPAVQLWAVWAVHHVCSKNPKRYVEMLVAERGAHTIRAIVEQRNSSSAEDDDHKDDDNCSRVLRELCRNTLEVIRKEKPFIYSHF